MLARAEVVGEPGTCGGIEGVEEVERRSERLLAVAHAAAAFGGEFDTQAATVEPPGLDQRTATELVNEVIRRLSGDEEEAADLAGMELAGVVEELHHLELGERDAELEQGGGEAGTQDAVDPSLSVDEAPSGGCLHVHGGFLP